MRACSYCARGNEESAISCVGCGTSLEADNPSAFNPNLDVFALAALWVGGTGTGLAVLLTLPFWAVTRGESVRPMGWVLWVLLLAIGTFVVGLICGLVGARSTRRTAAGVGLLLSVCPFPVAWLLIHLASAMRGFVFSP